MEHGKYGVCLLHVKDLLNHSSQAVHPLGQFYVAHAYLMPLKVVEIQPVQQGMEIGYLVVVLKGLQEKARQLHGGALAYKVGCGPEIGRGYGIYGKIQGVCVNTGQRNSGLGLIHLQVLLHHLEYQCRGVGSVLHVVYLSPWNIVPIGGVVVKDHYSAAHLAYICEDLFHPQGRAGIHHHNVLYWHILKFCRTLEREHGDKVGDHVASQGVQGVA